MKKVFFLTTVFAVVVSIFLLSSCGHSSSGGGSSYYGTSSSTNDNCAGELNAYCFTGTVTEVVGFLTYTVNSGDYECDCGENCTCCITEIKIKVVDGTETSCSNLKSALNNLSATASTGPYVSLDLTEATALDLSGSEAFGDSSSTTKYYALREVKLPENCTEIGEYAFRYQAGLQNVVFPKNLTSIGYEAFYKCSALESIDLSNTKVTKIVADSSSLGGMFSYCTSLKEVKLPGNLTSIGNNAFSECSALTEVNLSGCTALEEIGASAFGGCSSLTTLLTDGQDNKLPTSLMAMGRSAFEHCYALETIDLSETKLEEIEVYAFYMSSSLTTVYLPETINSIENYAFDGCSSLTTVDLSECTELEEIGYKAFYNCSSLTEIKMTKTAGYAWGHPSSTNKSVTNPSQSDLTMVTDFEDAPVYYLTGNSVEGETPQTTLSSGYNYYWYKVGYTE